MFVIPVKTFSGPSLNIYVILILLWCVHPQGNGNGDRKAGKGTGKETGKRIGKRIGKRDWKGGFVGTVRG